MQQKSLTQRDAGDELCNRAKEYQAAHPTATWDEAMHEALASDRELKAAYVGIEDIDTVEEIIDPQQVRADVDAAVQQYRREHPEVTYPAALTKVFSANPTLKAKYAAS